MRKIRESFPRNSFINVAAKPFLRKFRSIFRVSVCIVFPGRSRIDGFSRIEQATAKHAILGTEIVALYLPVIKLPG
jgi:hypothetical protein